MIELVDVLSGARHPQTMRQNRTLIAMPSNMINLILFQVHDGLCMLKPGMSLVAATNSDIYRGMVCGIMQSVALKI